MSSKFQKGDRVGVISNDEEVARFHDQTGTIVNVVNIEHPFVVEFEDGESENFKSNELELVKAVRSQKIGVARKDTMSGINKLTILAKSIVDADLRNMIKVGWLDSSLQLTEEGEEAILAHYLSANKADLGKLAEAELKERRKDKGREE